MTGVPRHIAKHRLNIREGCLPVRQKKRGQAPERNKAICEEVKKLDGTTLQFKSMTSGRYLSAEHGGGSIIVANRTSAKIELDGIAVTESSQQRKDIDKMREKPVIREEEVVESKEVITNLQSYDDNNGGKIDMANYESVHNNVSYANKLSNDMQMDELFFVPSTLNDNGKEVVLFKEELVKEGECGGRFGLKDIVIDAEANKEKVTQGKRNNDRSEKPPSKHEKIWNVGKENVTEIRKSANKYDVLVDKDNDDCNMDPFIDKRLIWAAIERMENENSDEDDVFESQNQAVNSLIIDEVV
ncbi:hypothetical protein Tco_0946155, partial [Tanacetum coccineum]